MKKLFVLFSSLMIGMYSFAWAQGIDQRFVRSFDSSFPNAQDVSWFVYPDAFEVAFIHGGFRARILYPKDESFVRLIRYYKEDNLPYQVRFLISKEFASSKISGVTEVSTIQVGRNDVSVVYYVIVEDAKKWMTVKIDRDGIMSVGKALKKTL
ncbi:MAG: hypothetical protein ACJ749_02060 [Flavisolibacter sp.]